MARLRRKILRLGDHNQPASARPVGAKADEGVEAAFYGVALGTLVDVAFQRARPGANVVIDEQGNPVRDPFTRNLRLRGVPADPLEVELTLKFRARLDEGFDGRDLGPLANRKVVLVAADSLDRLA